MGLFSQLTPRFSAKRQSKLSSQSVSSLQPSPSSKPRSTEELEQQMTLEAKVQPHSQPQRLHPVAVGVRRAWQRLVWTTVLLGIPVGAVALINLELCASLVYEEELSSVLVSG